MSWHSVGLVLCQIMAEKGKGEVCASEEKEGAETDPLCDNLLSQ